MLATLISLLAAALAPAAATTTTAAASPRVADVAAVSAVTSPREVADERRELAELRAAARADRAARPVDAPSPVAPSAAPSDKPARSVAPPPPARRPAPPPPPVPVPARPRAQAPAPARALAAAVVPASGRAGAAIGYARAHLGAPYVYGAAGPGSFDCSGLVVAAFAAAGRPGLPHSTGGLLGVGRPVSRDQLAPGDLVFPSGGHVGLYIGGGLMIHAPKPGDHVKVAPVYAFWTARRIS